jgi:hypothetical protein
LGCIFGDFYTNSSGHPAPERNGMNTIRKKVTRQTDAQTNQKTSANWTMLEEKFLKVFERYFQK